MQTEDTKKIDREIPQQGDALLSIEVGRDGIQRVFIYCEADELDKPTESHRLLARVMPQLALLNEAIRQVERAGRGRAGQGSARRG